VLSHCPLNHIKFKSNENHLLAWLKKESIFVNSDSLGIKHPITISHFTQIATNILHLKNFREHLINQLMLIDLEADTAVKLAPYLKAAQLELMSNGDEFTTILPNFELYHTRLSHRHAPNQVATNVIGVKCKPRDGKLLSKFFTCLASETSKDQRNGTFLPKGSSYLLGPQTYAQVLTDNNFFLLNVATIPVNLEYTALFTVIDPHTTSNTDPISLHEHLLRKHWFLCIESVNCNKSLIITTKPNLPDACTWINENLEPMVCKSIPPGINPSSSQLLPRRLDKPSYSATIQSYAEILKKQFSLTSNPSATMTDNNRPSCKCQTTKLDYDSDTSAKSLSTTTMETTIENNSYLTPVTVTQAMPSDAQISELLSLKNEIVQLKTTIMTVVQQIVKAVASLHATQ